MGSNKRYLIVIILAVIAITIAAIGSVKGAVATEPVRPWYLEPPEVFQPTHIREGDRLYASYFNEQFNVIYNWAQLLNREWKNFTNGTGIASITANLITAKDKIVTPVISIIKGNQPAPDGNGGLIYYDKDLDRFRAYQEGAWRDLSSNVYIASDTIGSPLTIQGYLQASNIYASNTVYAHGVNNTGTLTNTGNVVTEGLNANKRLKVPTFSSTQTADSSLGKGSLYYDSTNNKLKAYNGSTWEDVAEDSGEWTTSSTTGDKTFNNGKISFASDSDLIIPRANLVYSSPAGATDTLKLYNSDLYTYDSTWKRLTGVWKAPYTSGQKRWESNGERFYFEGNIEVGVGSRSSNNYYWITSPDTKNYTYSDSSYLKSLLTYEPTLLVGNCTKIDTNSAVGVGSLSGNITAPSFSHIRRIKESSSSGGSSDDISDPVIHIQSPNRYAIESSTIVDASGTVYAPYGLILPGEASATSKVNSLRVNNNGDLQLYYGGWKNVGASAQTVDTAMSDISTNAVQNKVIKTYVDRKTAGISSETANINHANIIDLNGGDIDATNVEVTTKLKIPTSKTSYPTTGSICFNAASDTLNVYDNGSWISFGSGGGQGSCVLVATKTYYITGEIEYYSTDGLYDQVKENYTNYFYLNTYSDGHLVLKIKEPLAERKAYIHSTYSAHSSKFYILPGTELFNLLHDKNAVLVNVPDDGHYVGLPSAETDGENIIGNIYFRYINAGDAGIIIDSIISWTSISITGHRVRMYGYKEPTIFFYPNN